VISPILILAQSGYIQIVRPRWVREGERMKRILSTFWKDDQAQDLIEYALMAGFVAVAAGAIMPNIATSISTVFSKIQSLLASAAS
jgi:pilus assembly protein Flp/PilA